jgi:hypothetical protein
MFTWGASTAVEGHGDMSFWLGDPDDLDRIAAQLDADAATVRETASSNVRRAQQARWVSISAQRYRDVVAADRRRADAAAEQLERAAEALRAHAAQIRETLARLARAGEAGIAWFTTHVADVLPVRAREIVPGLAGRLERVLEPGGALTSHTGGGD